MKNEGNYGYPCFFKKEVLNVRIIFSVACARVYYMARVRDIRVCRYDSY